VLLYFSNRPAVPGTIDLEQLQKLIEFKVEMKEQGLQETYSDDAEFRAKLARHINDVINRLGIDGNNNAENEIQQNSSAKRDFLTQFGNFLRGYAAEWTSEHESQPIDTTSARDIYSVPLLN